MIHNPPLPAQRSVAAPRDVAGRGAGATGSMFRLGGGATPRAASPALPGSRSGVREGQRRCGSALLRSGLVRACGIVNPMHRAECIRCNDLRSPGHILAIPAAAGGSQ